MTSAFHAIEPREERHCLGFQQEQHRCKRSAATQAKENSDNETEDEEVKMTCLRGVHGFEDSDINSFCSSGEEEEEESDTEEQGEYSSDGSQQDEHILNFSSARPLSETIIHPRPSQLGKMLSRDRVDEEGESDDGDVPLAEESESVSSSPVKLDCTMHEAATPKREGQLAVSDDHEDADDESGDSDEEEDDFSVDMEGCADECSTEPSTEPSTERDVDLEVLSDDEAEIVIGVSLDQVRAKRPISIFDEIETMAATPPKRRKSQVAEQSSLPFMPFSLGEPAVVDQQDSRIILLSSDDDDERELDGQLRESDFGRDISPVPLFTPPASPLGFEGDGIASCEWPSNLTVDNGFTAAVVNHIRPLSPTLSVMSGDCDVSKLDELRDSSTLLTPLLRCMAVRKV